MFAHGIAEYGRCEAYADLVGPSFAQFCNRFRLTIDAAEELIVTSFTCLSKRGQSPQNDRIGTQDDIDIGMREQDRLHRGIPHPPSSRFAARYRR